MDHTNSLPPWIQIKEQIKFAYMLGRLKGGDVLPSIRVLAQQLGVGEAAVRRAYEELAKLGFLSTSQRRHVMVKDDLARPPHVEKLAAESKAECHRWMRCAKKRGVSSIAMARLLLQESMADETSDPSYLYVDLGPSLARNLAEQIARAWEIPVAGRGFRLGGLPGRGLDHYAAILVNTYRYERLLEMIGGKQDNVFPIRVRLSDSLLGKIRRQRDGSVVLLVVPDADLPKISRPLVDYVQGEVSEKVEFETTGIGQIPDLAALAQTKEYRLIIVSAHFWEEVPEKAKSLPSIIPTETQLDVESLEAVRVPAGVLL